jgi:hypothetical protein
MLLGEIRHIIIVLYVPFFVKNLLLVGSIAKQGYLIMFSQWKWWIVQVNNLDEIVRDKNNGLYR